MSDYVFGVSKLANWGTGGAVKRSNVCSCHMIGHGNDQNVNSLKGWLTIETFTETLSCVDLLFLKVACSFRSCWKQVLNGWIGWESLVWNSRANVRITCVSVCSLISFSNPASACEKTTKNPGKMKNVTIELSLRKGNWLSSKNTGKMKSDLVVNPFLLPKSGCNENSRENAINSVWQPLLLRRKRRGLRDFVRGLMGLTFHKIDGEEHRDCNCWALFTEGSMNLNQRSLTGVP